MVVWPGTRDETPFVLVTRRSVTASPSPVVAVLMLLAAAGSAVALDTVAVFKIGSGDTYPEGMAYVVTIVCTAPGARVPSAHGEAVVHAPAFDTNVRPVGVGSVTVTATASDGPAFVTTVV